MSTSVWAVVPCHNERASVLKCLEVLRADHPEVGAIVVDDGSTDDTGDAVRASFPSAIVLRGDGDLWWSGAVNLGIVRARELGATHVVFLNNDSFVPKGGIARLVEASQRSGGTVVGAAVADLDGTPESYGGVINYRGPDYLLVAPPVDEFGLADVDWLPGHVIVVPTDVFERVGLTDARRFPQYFGDTDFTMRVVRAGIRLAILPEVLSLNDRTQTGLRLKVPVRPKNLWTVLTSQRSWLRVSDNVRFYRAHRDRLNYVQLLRRYENIPILIATEILGILHLRGPIRKVRRALR